VDYDKLQIVILVAWISACGFRGINRARTLSGHLFLTRSANGAKQGEVKSTKRLPFTFFQADTVDFRVVGG